MHDERKTLQTNSGGRPPERRKVNSETKCQPLLWNHLPSDVLFHVLFPTMSYEDLTRLLEVCRGEKKLADTVSVLDNYLWYTPHDYGNVKWPG